MIAAVWRTATCVWLARSFACDWWNLSHFGRGFYCAWCQESRFRDCSVNKPRSLYRHRTKESFVIVWVTNRIHPLINNTDFVSKGMKHDHNIKKTNFAIVPVVAKISYVETFQVLSCIGIQRHFWNDKRRFRNS